MQEASSNNKQTIEVGGGEEAWCANRYVPDGLCPAKGKYENNRRYRACPEDGSGREWVGKVKAMKEKEVGIMVKEKKEELKRRRVLMVGGVEKIGDAVVRRTKRKGVER